MAWATASPAAARPPAEAVAEAPALLPFAHSLRAKVALGFTAACVLLVLLQAIAVLVINAYQEHELVDQIVSDEMEDLIDQYERREMVAGPPVSTLKRFDVRGDGETQNLRKWFRANWLTHSFIARGDHEMRFLPPELQSLRPGFHDVTSGSERFRVEVRESGSVHFYLAYSLEQHQNRLDQFRLAVAASVAATAIAGIAVALWLSGLLTRQVADLAARVERLDDGSAGEVLERHFRDREVAALAHAFDAFQRRMARLLERERAFTADVSHELRTPLTSIQTSSELMLDDDSLSPKSRERVAKIARASARLSELVNAFLVLAHEQAGGARTEVCLRDCIEEALEPVRERAEGKGLAIVVDVPPELSVRIPVNALRVVLSNLVGNAVSYTDRGEIAVAVAGDRIEILDTGSGIDPDQVPDLFRRFRRGDSQRGEGFGLGLAIVKRICEQTGWQIDVRQREGGGSRVSFGPV